MIRSFRMMAVAAVAMGVASGAFAATATVEFKTFYDPSTVLNAKDTKTLSYSVASLKLVDNVGGGVTGTLTYNDTLFPAGSKGLSIDELWIASSIKGSAASKSGSALSGTYYKNGFYEEGGKYNYDINFKAGSFKEGSTSQFTISGATVGSMSSGLTINPATSKGIMLEVTGAGKPYANLFNPTGNVHFIGVITIPEPSTYALMGLGLVGVIAASRKRKAA
jgi:hypothetical protein